MAVEKDPEREQGARIIIVEGAVSRAQHAKKNHQQA